MSFKYITPRKIKNSQKKLNFSKIYFADFETFVSLDKHYLTCFSLYSPKMKKNSCVQAVTDLQEDNLELKSQILLESFLSFCFSFKTNSCVYFHNLSRFDGLFILKYLASSTKYTSELITRENAIYQIKLINSEGKILFFRDTFLLFPMSLEKFATMFNINITLLACKTDFDHENIKITDYSNSDFVNKLQNYCFNDSKILAKCFMQFSNLIFESFKVDPLKTLTISALAFKIFRTSFYETAIIYKSYGFLDYFIRKSYKGGIVNVYKPYLENGYHYDVNSLYPFIMKTCEMPVGKGIFEKINGGFDILDFFGFIECKVFCPQDVYIPFLCIQSKEGLISPTGFFEGVFFSEEIKYALSLNVGYSFEYKRGYRFEKAVLFKNYVEVLYQKRLNNKNTPLEKVIKFLLNSLYGRFGMNSLKNKTALLNLDKQKNKELYVNALLNSHFQEVSHINNVLIYKYNTVFSINELRDKLKKKEISINKYNELLNSLDSKNHDLNMAVHISSAITAYARIYMHKFKNEYKDNLYYSDTDSLILNKELSTNLISTTELGKFKLEGKIKRGFFIAPKLYYLVTDTDNLIIKSKGINPNLLTEEDFSLLYSNKIIKKFFINNFTRNLTTFEIQRTHLSKELQGNFSKRQKVYKNNKWSDTIPIYLEKKDVPFLESLFKKE